MIGMEAADGREQASGLWFLRDVELNV